MGAPWGRPGGVLDPATSSLARCLWGLCFDSSFFSTVCMLSAGFWPFYHVAHSSILPCPVLSVSFPLTSSTRQQRSIGFVFRRLFCSWRIPPFGPLPVFCFVASLGVLLSARVLLPHDMRMRKCDELGDLRSSSPASQPFGRYAYLLASS